MCLGWRGYGDTSEIGVGASFLVMNDSSSHVVCVCLRQGGAVGVENREWGHLVELRQFVSLLLLREIFKAKPQSLDLDLIWILCFAVDESALTARPRTLVLGSVSLVNSLCLPRLIFISSSESKPLTKIFHWWESCQSMCSLLLSGAKAEMKIYPH